MKINQSLQKGIFLTFFIILTVNLTVRAQTPESKGKEYELVVGVPGINTVAIADVKTMLGQNADVKDVIFCPKHDVFLVYLNREVQNGNEKTGLNPNTIVNSIQTTAGKPAFKKDVSATEFYQDCSYYLKNN